MKKKISLVMMFILSSLSFAEKDLKFEILEKNNTDIKIQIRPQEYIPENEITEDDESEEVEEKENIVANNSTVETTENIDEENFYVVKSGDSLAKIAKSKGLLTSELIELNNITGSIKVGQVLRIKKEGSGRGKTYKTKTTKSKKENIYIVKKGDTLFRIANRFGVTVDALKRENDLLDNNLEVGQALKVNSNVSGAKTSYTKSKTYKVRKGDTLFSIANKFGTTVDALKMENNLSSNILEVAQLLKVNSDFSEVEVSFAKPKVYRVRKGDTLFSIANRFGISLEKLLKQNGLEEGEVIEIGQELKID